MDEPVIRLTYDGGDAAANAIDMRLLGLSLQGADRITSDGLILLLHQRSPKRRERAPLIIKVREPEAGSWSVPGFLQDAAWLLALGYQMLPDITSEYLKEWWQAVKARFTGNRSDVDLAVEAMLVMNREHLAARDAAELRSHDREMVMLSMIHETLALQQRPLEHFAAPIGPSVGSATLATGKSQPVSISSADADAIREMGELTWEPLAEIVLKTDGFRFHKIGRAHV